MNAVMYFLQRLTALILAPLVIVHLVLIVYAVRGGISAAEILGRTQGSVLWGLFYGLFVVVVAMHGTIGLRVIASEWTPLRARALDVGVGLFGLLLLFLGLRAVYAVVVSAGP